MKVRIVAIDDDVLVLELFELAFAQLPGCEVIGVSSLAQLDRTVVCDVDLVLLDAHVPGTAIAELVSRVRARWPAVPIVLVTGDASGARELVSTFDLAGALMKSPALTHLALTALELAGVQRD
jgi:DNA-binding response OmpR family regulator